MDDRELLAARLASALADLGKAKQAMSVYEPKKTLISATWGTLRNDLEAHRSRLVKLLKELETEPLETSWSGLSKLQPGLRSTTNEVLALLQGGPLRDAEEEGGVYSLSDALVQEVAGEIGIPWAGMTLPAERELVDTRSSLIRLTFPASLWDLPLALHEYGHQVAPEILDGMGSRAFTLMRDGLRSPIERAHLTELFADAFAAYAGGPAYACTLILFRFDPAADEALKDLPTHPSHDRRVALVLRVLKEREGEVTDAQWSALVEQLAAAWRSSLQLARADPASGPPQDSPQTGRRLERLQEIVARLPNARYRTWGKALELVPFLEEGRGSVPAKDFSIRDVLNAAWLARLELPADWSEIERRAELVARAVSRYRSGGHRGR